ncbi:nitronate monooxygenase [Neorhizobium huautlense]|uniref:Nitronate monooxygenase n=1 Tax=Neorhizobium huautlense TaxID=67774 RepID=A0ABT9PQL4_9HYPH|nr:nitronate monooxygenase family protein [Neorhizobium huautlense]MDP9836760.1 nitronate monooxygenase [Neorhizobium huautlense]
MPLPRIFEGLRLPAIAAPMFLASGPDLVVEVCRSGLVGTFPALNQRTTDGFVEWLGEINARLADVPDAAPYGVNLIVHRSNPRLEADLYKIVEHKVPLIITSLGAVPDVVNAVHSYGGLVFHDVINRRHAEKAAEAGVDGIIAVTAGAGGHAGMLSPFALIPEIRSFFDGTIILSGAMSTGEQIAAARVMGADMAYLGTRFLATKEATISEEQKRMTVDAKAADIFYTPAISGVAANFLRPSLVAAGLDPDNLVSHGAMDLGNEAKAWKTVWSAGQGVASLKDVPGAAELCERLIAEYAQAMARAGSDPFAVRAKSA